MREHAPAPQTSSVGDLAQLGQNDDSPHKRIIVTSTILISRLLPEISQAVGVRVCVCIRSLMYLDYFVEAGPKSTQPLPQNAHSGQRCTDATSTPCLAWPLGMPSLKNATGVHHHPAPVVRCLSCFHGGLFLCDCPCDWVFAARHPLMGLACLLCFVACFCLRARLLASFLSCFLARLLSCVPIHLLAC